MDKLGTNLADMDTVAVDQNTNLFKKLIKIYSDEIKVIHQGGGTLSIEKQHSKGRLTARERINNLIDENTRLFELGTFAAWKMYTEYGSPASSGVISGIGSICNIQCVIIANDATVKAGAYFEVSLKKTIRAQQIALENNIPIIYLVDSAGVFLPLQDQVFPDEAHFGKIFYNNAKLSANGITQIACVMGPCVAGGAYLPVMCDKYIIIEGASMFLAGPALVKAAIGQEIDEELLGGATTHHSISGTADYHEKDDLAGIDRIRDIIKNINFSHTYSFKVGKSTEPDFSNEDLISLFSPDNPAQYDIKEVLARILDNSEFLEYKKDYGKTIVCGNGKIGGINVGVVANQKINSKTKLGELQLGGVIYSDSADKAARFVMNANQDKVPLIFIHDVNGFMVGKVAEWGGIAKDGAKLVNAVSNSVVPKITLIIGGSYGAGNYAMSGRAYKPSFIYAWPTAKIAVMGGEQAAKTLTSIKTSKMGDIDDALKKKIFNEIKSKYDKQSDPRYAAARLWIDEIIDPRSTRSVIINSLLVVRNRKLDKPNYGVLQV